MLKTLMKKVHTAVQEKKMETAQHTLLEVTSALDKAAAKGFIHRNTAARRVSRLTLKVNSIPGSGESGKSSLGPSTEKGA
jgi:small subunit ribosomal protein S20